MRRAIFGRAFLRKLKISGLDPSLREGPVLAKKCIVCKGLHGRWLAAKLPRLDVLTW
jgi:hypothetical protein